MYSKSELKKIIVLDIETTSNYINYNEFSENRPGEIKFWQRKTKSMKNEQSDLVDLSDSDLYESRAALYPEFGRIIVISIGQILFDEDDNPSFQKRSFYGSDEKKVISEFINFMSAVFNKIPDIKILGHNLKGFDIPYILKKCLIFNIRIPQRLQLHKIKPWENCLLDTMEIWKSGNWGGSISLEHLTYLLEIENPKEAAVYGEDYGGIHRAFWQGKLEEIKDYCEDDIKATANILLKFSNFNAIKEKTKINNT
tara:strand:+ start:4944 stop:5705 length:762 start_codon:yes stop_codon:yes gene_type:complete